MAHAHHLCCALFAQVGKAVFGHGEIDVVRPSATGRRRPCGDDPADAVAPAARGKRDDAERVGGAPATREVGRAPGPDIQPCGPNSARAWSKRSTLIAELIATKRPAAEIVGSACVVSRRLLAGSRSVV